MPVWRMQLSTWLDDTLPASALIINPHFDDKLPFTDPTNLCNDLLDVWEGFILGSGKTSQMECKAYDAQGSKPVYPAATVTRRPGVAQTANFLREPACCLSYYADFNRPRHRGRLYLPLCFLTTVQQGSRPDAAMRTKVGSLAPLLADIGGVDVDWVVYSRADDAARKVTHWWVDDSWDVQRRRGTRPVVRTTGTTSG